ncbi:MAG: hypothetical protein J6M60_02645 [Clostridia bacterium]|nr:hypothetical protein [Clostridia bacterium]
MNFNKSSESADFSNDSSFPNFNDFVSSFENFNDKNSQSTESVGNSDNPFLNIDMGTILKIKQIMDSMNKNENNPRSNLLLSLKPYLRPERRPKVDQYIKIFNMSSMMDNFKSMGGDN